MNSFDFTAGEDGNIFLPRIEEPRSSSAAVYVFPQPLLRFRGQNSLSERMRIGLVATGIVSPGFIEFLKNFPIQIGSEMEVGVFVPGERLLQDFVGISLPIR